MTEKRRVVITGMGLISPLGGNLKSSWNNIIAGKSGISKISLFDSSNLPTQIAGEVPEGEDQESFNVKNYFDGKEIKKMDRFMVFGVAATIDAFTDSGLTIETEEESYMAGTMIGSGIGGLDYIEKTSVIIEKKGPRRINPFFIPASLCNLTAGHVSMKYNLMGPNSCIVTACATGTHCIGASYEIIKRGDADVMVSGGAEAAICSSGIGGFCSMKALSTKYNDHPTKASRPWDEGRDGFVMGEGAGIVVLEEYEKAKKRGAKIYAEILGYGMSGDAHHISAPHPEGKGAQRAMQVALKKSNLSVDDLGYINAHGTSTPLGDVAELNAIKNLFQGDVKNTSISSTKSSTGHLLGAAGGAEAILSVKALQEGILPPTINLENPCQEAKDFDLVANVAKEKNIKACLSNSFGFGGTNATLIFGKV